MTNRSHNGGFIVICMQRECKEIHFKTEIYGLKNEFEIHDFYLCQMPKVKYMYVT